MSEVYPAITLAICPEEAVSTLLPVKEDREERRGGGECFGCSKHLQCMRQREESLEERMSKNLHWSPLKPSRSASLNLWVATPVGVKRPFHRVAYQTSCISDISVMLRNRSKTTVMK